MPNNNKRHRWRRDLKKAPKVVALKTVRFARRVLVAIAVVLAIASFIAHAYDWRQRQLAISSVTRGLVALDQGHVDTARALYYDALRRAEWSLVTGTNARSGLAALSRLLRLPFPATWDRLRRALAQLAAKF